MPQTFIDPQHISGNKFIIHGPEAHHLTRVLRCKPHDGIQLFDGTGRQYNGVLTRVSTEETVVEGQITEIISHQRPAHYVRLFQGYPKGQKFDYVLEKAVELGADEIIPFLSQKSLIKMESGKSDSKTSRWERLIKAAAKQCGRPNLPAISTLVSLSDLGSQISLGFSLLLSADSSSQPLSNVLAEMKNRVLPESARINIIVGPESGFSDKEMAWLVGLGARPASMGSLVLRTETAGLVALSIINYEFQRI